MAEGEAEMSSCLENPVWPCAMTGACAVLSGFSGLSVVIHGSSGCYYYPRSLLKVPLYSTYLLESEIVFGSVERLHDVVAGLEQADKDVAVVNTCIPGLTGEDLSCAFAKTHAIFVDAPGFLGGAEKGAAAAYESLNVKVTGREGVNIDGVCGLDLFARGNLHEAQRMLALAGIPTAVSFAADSYANLKAGAAPYSVSVNPSWDSGIGTALGSLLFPDMKATADRLAERFPSADTDALMKEYEQADEKILYYSDKYLRKYTPPVAVVAGQKSYCEFVRAMLVRCFGSDVPVILPREEVTDFSEIKEKIQGAEPDIIIGSTFEAGICDAAFCGITIPDRSRISMSARAVSGIEGGVMFMESVLNALIDFKKRKYTPPGY
ncbi:MAG: nitrogenase component 1 [Methanocorpusculum sp.]|nr:nitrogenase component 1 [Methanocorpusculum sp.]